MENVATRQDVLTDDIRPEDQKELEAGLAFAAEHANMLDALPAAVQQAIIEMGTAYLNNDNYTYFKKLFKNAVPYVAEGRIRREDGYYQVEGNTNDHRVTIEEDSSMACDCDLFHGRGKFADKGGECSHIQAVTLLKLSETQTP